MNRVNEVMMVLAEQFHAPDNHSVNHINPNQDLSELFVIGKKKIKLNAAWKNERGPCPLSCVLGAQAQWWIYYYSTVVPI